MGSSNGAVFPSVTSPSPSQLSEAPTSVADPDPTSLLIAQALAQTSSSSKRGIAYIRGEAAHEADYNLLLSSKSPLNWYYTWLPTVAPSDIFQGDQADTIEFVPTIHNNTKVDEDLESLKSLPASSKHLFTFNEPDGTFETGGSDLTPQVAARVYIEKIVPLRNRFQISHPSTTGSQRGFQWLQDFNAACWAIDPENGCPADFVVIHWYGDFVGMTSWIGQLAAWYRESKVGLQGELRVWVTELGVPGADMAANHAVMTQTLPFLDQLDYVEKYAWFGQFRPDGANNWTGAGLSLFENDGGLSTLGATYLGGQTTGFSVGDKGQESSSTGGKGGSGNNSNSTGNDNSTDAGAGAGSGNSTSNDTSSGTQGSEDKGSGSVSVASAATSMLWMCVVTLGIWVLE
ncbi:hypothetical protein JX265_011242 [Neoarthrinium moseri]|uniref:Asl1-like glycosyl hydrolase catalytic domain-containing protein n=1 Tax=Neoarthrinium moseri TaxID=1658444 RepID=A0A9P9WCR8_9PEZI|nr:hypothetical protein JX266_007950 [Neoarthrinium moseri]KAI1857507.1 hypothetical protein JX265_011242 [Neoarthrinium moseri]